MAEQTEQGTCHVIAIAHGPDPEQAARGRFQWTGRYWQYLSAHAWGPIGTAAMFTTEERAKCESLAATVGGQWVTLFVNVDPDQDGGR